MIFVGIINLDLVYCSSMCQSESNHVCLLYIKCLVLMSSTRYLKEFFTLDGFGGKLSLSGLGDLYFGNEHIYLGLQINKK